MDKINSTTFEESEQVELKTGLTSRTLLAIIFVAAFMLPITTYLSLFSGATLTGASIYITVILFSEVSRIVGRPLNKQELFIIFQAAAPTLLATPFLDFVYRRYFMLSPYSNLFEMPETNTAVVRTIPNWWAPPLGSVAYKVRTLLVKDWTLPVAITLFQFYLLWILQEIALAYFLAVLYVDQEKLPFPYANVAAETCSVLAERDPEKMSAFTIGLLLGALYAVPLYMIPTITQGLFGVAITPIPVPWLDLTTGNLGIEKILPGAILGLSTDLTTFAGGFIIPFSTAVQILFGSITIWVFGNWITRTYLSSTFPEWAKEWSKGMSLSLAYQRSMIRVWISPFVAFAIGAAAFSIIKSWKTVIRSFKTIIKLPSYMKTSGYISLPVLLVLYLGGILTSVLVFHWLVPDYPLWIAILVPTVGGFLSALISARALGETGISMNIPYIWQMSVILSGYKGIGPWLISPVFSGLYTAGAPQWTQTIKAARLTGTKPSDFFKAYIIAVVFSVLFSFVYVSFLWMIAPIPSSTYPFTMIQWPVNVLSSLLWITGKVIVNSEIIVWSLGIIIVIGLLGEIVSRTFKIPFSLATIVVGMMTIPPASIPIFIGSFVGKFIMEKILGPEKWRLQKTLLVSGLLAGQGIAVGIAVAVLMISKASWILPW